MRKTEHSIHKIALDGQPFSEPVYSDILYPYVHNLSPMKFVVGILAMILGVIMVIKTEWFIQNLGSNAWAEAHLGSGGGSRPMY